MAMALPGPTGRHKGYWVAPKLLLAVIVPFYAQASTSTLASNSALTEKLAGRNFFDQATRSIDHDKSVLAKLEKHPLAHASGWEIHETQDPDKGWSEKAYSQGPRLGGKEWQKKNQKLEKDLERMSDSVNVMFKDQGNKRRYQRDEDKLFNEAVSALKTADQLYPDTPSGNSGKHGDSNFASDQGGRSRARASGGNKVVKALRHSNCIAVVKIKNPNDRMVTVVPMKPLPRPPFSVKAKKVGYLPNMTEVFLILSGCTMLAAAGWIGFTFFRRKSYYDLRARSDRPDGIEVP